MNRTILDLCAGTGSWSKPYREAGYRVVEIDTCMGLDVRLVRPDQIGEVHGILAAPPCTHLASSGARWWKSKGEAALLEALSVADACLRVVALLNPDWWALENPVGRLRHYYGEPTLIFDPCDYGDPWTKKTCLWGDFQIPEPCAVEPSGKNPVHHMSPPPWRARYRSKTPDGFARAFFEAND
jgi:site-specific DNA-cytosine methylase